MTHSIPEPDTVITPWDEPPAESSLEKCNGGCTSICVRCDGTGLVDGKPCFSCDGTGWRR